MVLAVMAASVVILTAGYILWTMQRVYLGPEYKGPHGEAITPINGRELSIIVPLVVMAIVLGVYPRWLLDCTTPTVDRMVNDLTRWTVTVKQPPPETAVPVPRVSESKMRVPLQPVLGLEKPKTP